MGKTKIEWCDEVWNPVWGCLRGCPYCYARSIARRFGKTEAERSFFPTIIERNLTPRFAKNTKRVFVGSMSDPEYWDNRTWFNVQNVIEAHPDIDFIFLTKGTPSVYRWLLQFDLPNVILGLTRCSALEIINKILPQRGTMTRWLLNIEPIQEPGLGSGDAIRLACTYFDWIILGAETGNRKEKIIPDWFWFNMLVTLRRQIRPAIFVKPSLHHLFPGNRDIPLEFPERLS